MKRVELGIHTNMSATIGVNPPVDYINAALMDWMPAIAVTDRSSVQAFPEAYKAVSETGGIKLIYGVELDYQKDEDIYYLSILAKNRQGLRAMYQLISDAYTGHGNKQPMISLDEIAKRRENLLLGINLLSEPIDAVLSGKNDTELKNILSFYDYILLPPVSYLQYFLDRKGIRNTDNLTEIYERIIALCNKLGKPAIASDSPHFVYSNNGECRKIVRFCNGDTGYRNQPNMRFRTTEEMLEEFRFLPKEKAFEIVVKNSNSIAEQTDGTFPPFPQEKRYPTIEQAEEKLQKAAYVEVERRYGNPLHEEIKKRLEWELDAITANGYAACYLIAQNLVNAATKQGYLTGSRGALASSFVAFLLGITEINPLVPHYYCPNCHTIEFRDDMRCGSDLPDKNCPQCREMMKKDGFSIPAETFMGAEGDKEPYFGFNTAVTCLNTYDSQLIRMFGANRVVRAGTVWTLSDRVASGMVAQYCKIKNVKYPDWLKNNLEKNMIGIKRGDGTLPGGILIAPEHADIFDYTPIRVSDNDTISIIEKITHMDYHALCVSLWKIDILCHDNPALLHKLERLTGICPKDIPFDDKETFKLFQTGQTIGIYEFSSPYVREKIMKVAPPKSFDDLIRIFGLSQGTNTWLENADDLIQNEGKRLSEVIACRDDVMLRLLKHGYDRKEAFRICEQVRKGGDRLISEDCETMRKHGVPEWYIDSCRKILYLFPRAHAAAYVLLSYRIAYYKAHDPLAFYCAYFATNAIDFDRDFLTNDPALIQAMILECENGVRDDCYGEVLKICEEMLDAGYTFDTENVDTDFHISDFTIENGKIKPIVA